MTPRSLASLLAATVAWGAAGAAQAQLTTEPLVPGGIKEGELTSRHPRLSDGSHMDCFLLPTTAGQTYIVTLVSNDFDTYLLADAAGCGARAPAQRNDNLRSGVTDSQLVVDGTGATFGVFVTTSRPGGTGAFSLGVSGGQPTRAAARPRATVAQAAPPSVSPGWAALAAEDYARAAQLLRPLAEAGDADAQNAMGFMTFYGRGVPQNRLEAGRWYGLSAEQGNEQAQRTLNAIAPNLMEAQFVDHIDRFGPDMTDPGTFHFDVSVYCIYRGPNCQTWRARYQEFEGRWNRRAERINMARIWGVYTGGPDEDGWRRAAERSACMRRVTESIQRQTYGQQTWRYVNSC